MMPEGNWRTIIMAGQLLPPPDMDPPPLDHLTPTQRIQLWVDLMDACEEMLLAGLRQKVGPHGDVQAAYRQWYAEQMEEHDRVMQHMVDEFNRRSASKPT
jgi:hypothetical protein